jgi:hypothetical protein
MATQLMKNWIVELHNPERKQTQGLLGRKNAEGVQSNCCLGVLCEVDGIEPSESSLDDGTFVLMYEGREGMPNSEVIARVLGKDEEDYWNETVDLYEDQDEDGHISTIPADEANDTYGLTFKEIAQKLEERYLSEDEAFEVRKRVEDLGWA